MNVLRNVGNFIQSKSHTNITLLGMPHRFDLMKSSCVSDEICKCIGKLQELVKHLKGVSSVKINHKTESFTQH